MPPLLSVEDLSVEFRTLEGRFRAVNELSFEVHPGRTLAVIGESGSGKSVTAQAILGLLPPVAFQLGGRILFRDRGGAPVDLAALPRTGEVFQAIRGDRIAMIFQEPTAALSPLHTVGDQIGEVLRRHRGTDGPAARAQAIEMLGRVGFAKPEKAVDAYSFQLSGGLCQRAMIAIAMICRPALIIADEPTTALDVTVQAEILKLLRDLQESDGTAILLIAHDLGVVANMADDMIVVHHGDTMERGPARELFARPRHAYLKALMGSVPRLDMAPGERLKPLREIEVGDTVARWAAARADKSGHGMGEPLVRLRGIRKTYAERRAFSFGPAPADAAPAVADVDLDIRRGECLGLVGESGCGKTTLSRILARSETPDAGTVEMAGPDGWQDVMALEGDALRGWRRRVQYVFQNPYLALNPRMTVEQILAEPLVIHGIGNAATRRARIRDLLALVGLQEAHLGRFPHSFSGGQRQRIGIARALALEPDLILFDEPVSALDVSVQAQILNLLRDLRRELGLTYLFVSHNLAVVDYLADRIAVMAAGRLVEVAPRDTLFRAPVHPYTKKLIASVPEPDPDRPIDFSLFGPGRSRDPASWGWPFSAASDRASQPEGHEPHLLDLGGGHHVRAFASAASELRA
ncbi:dipeptide ABC transporter ATP-binding protein [Aureimonas pseudogalii]|uniref:Peptide/nickel transport system ATP-binding protein n=1 Tax=Aureimonas pseudogalii TaxID=1744844 RepID=A0A7W6E7W0_9HYPH|nr:ABC transporter ATP-binding protein [Aureimonas pseudogalii]MBB3996367.1 peptide/nickel transport system ATP-binding protein [Aureimonas pseudogalii]